MIAGLVPTGRLAPLEEHSVYPRKVIGSSPIPPISRCYKRINCFPLSGSNQDIPQASKVTKVLRVCGIAKIKGGPRSELLYATTHHDVFANRRCLPVVICPESLADFS